MVEIARSELILGGQKSGKSRHAENLAAVWLQAAPLHSATLIATATAGDDEMRQRIARHQYDRSLCLPGVATLEVPLHLDAALREHSAPGHLLVVDCITLWLTNLLMPLHGEPLAEKEVASAVGALLVTLDHARGPVVLVSNEIGLGVVPMGREARHFVDRLGRLNQALAAVCERVTLMSAGLPLRLKGVA
jgi:adenosylcobinamide kinase/adenosylcobinamide-phosphate guanylyltransferase